MRIETERLVLRLPVLADATAAGEMLGDPEVMRFIGGQTLPPEAWESAVTRWIGRWEENDMGPFVVERRDDGRFLGRTGLLVWDVRTWTQSTFANAGEFAQPELGWAFARSAWRHGYATEAAAAARDWALERVDSLISVINPDNVRSQRVAARLGAEPAETVPLYDSGPSVVWRYPR